jgi:hypothetical protein
LKSANNRSPTALPIAIRRPMFSYVALQVHQSNN